MAALLRTLYSAAMWLAQPVLRAKLKRRAVLEPLYGTNIQERFGYYAAPSGLPQSAAKQFDKTSADSASAAKAQAWVWFHAVSLGETRAAAILITQLRQQLPGMALLLTHGTATGREEGARLLQPGDRQVWQPWDTQGATERFFRQFKPRIGIIMETEVWPNLCAAAQRAGVPMVLANARLSEASLRKAQRMAWLARPAYASFAQVWAQTEPDAQRLLAAGARHITVQGNIKFDATLPAAQLAQGRVWRAAGTRPVVLLASSREGEEALFIQEIKQLIKHFSDVDINKFAINNVVNAPSQNHVHSAPSVQWLIVPRHPQRFDEVAALLAQAGLSVSRRSQWQGDPHRSPEPADVWLGDSLGEMALYYAMADCALLGGSFAPFGGQNLIEAIAAGCPVVMGPHTFNFADAATTAQDHGAALRAQDMAQGVQIAVQLACTNAQKQTMQQAGEQWLALSRGAAQRNAQSVERLLTHSSTKTAT